MSFQGTISLTTFSHAISAEIYRHGDHIKSENKLATLNSRNFAYTFYYSDLMEVLS